jgi:hypothetical protein
MGDTLRDYNTAITRRQGTVQVLEAAVRTVTTTGRAVVVIGTPIPWEAIATRPWFDAERIRRRYDVLRDSVQEAGGVFVDLHDLLRQEEFADYGGHFLESGAQHIAGQIFPHVRAALQRASVARDGGQSARAGG